MVEDEGAQEGLPGVPPPKDLVEVSFLGAKQLVQFAGYRLGDTVKVELVGQLVEDGTRRTTEKGKTKFAKIQVDAVEIIG